MIEAHWLWLTGQDDKLMPYSIRQADDGYDVIKKDTGDVGSHHDTEKLARNRSGPCTRTTTERGLTDGFARRKKS